jgi:hypothetical protein
MITGAGVMTVTNSVIEGNISTVVGAVTMTGSQAGGTIKSGAALTMTNSKQNVANYGDYRGNDRIIYRGEKIQ